MYIKTLSTCLYVHTVCTYKIHQRFQEKKIQPNLFLKIFRPLRRSTLGSTLHNSSSCVNETNTSLSTNLYIVSAGVHIGHDGPHEWHHRSEI